MARIIDRTNAFHLPESVKSVQSVVSALWDLLPQAASIARNPNAKSQIPGKSQSPNSKKCRTTDFTDHADVEELYS
jgi:hypothetical protein